MKNIKTCLLGMNPLHHSLVKNKYKGKDKGYLAEIKLLNYKVFFKIINRGPVGFAESYMDGDFTSKNLSNLLLFSYDNQKYLLKNKRTNIILQQYFRFVTKKSQISCFLL